MQVVVNNTKLSDRAKGIRAIEKKLRQVGHVPSYLHDTESMSLVCLGLRLTISSRRRRAAKSWTCTN